MHYRPALCLVAAGAAFVAATPLSAAPLDDTDRIARVALHRFANCAAHKAPAVGRALLATPRASAAEFRLGLRLTRRVAGACLASGDSPQVNPTLLRGGVAEALYRRKFGIGPAAVASRTAPLTSDMERFAHCVVASRFEAVDRLLRSLPATVDETNAFAELVPALGPCISNGMKVAFNRSILRGVLAEALYAAAENRAG